MTDEQENTNPDVQRAMEDLLRQQYEGLPLEDQVAALRQSLEESQRSAEENRDAAQRAQAELINYRRRADEDRITLQQYSNSRLIIKLLPVIDELDLAIGHAEENNSSDSWWEGVKLIHRKIGGLLESEGVVKVEAVGEIFDPLQHEALGTMETSEYPPGYIVEVVRNGYRLHDRVIQPAQVVVAREARPPEGISNQPTQA
jgi:molecular chaperone GrpE